MDEEAWVEQGKGIMQVLFEEMYPRIAAWVKDMGRIEIGYRYDSPDSSFLRVIQHTQMIWSADNRFSSTDEALAEIDVAIADWCEEQGISLEDD